jgi:hypothetical protein
MLPTPSCLLNADVSGTGGGGKAYGLEAIAGVYHRVEGSGTTATQRIPRDRKPHMTQADQRPHTTERWGTQDADGDWQEAGHASPGGGGQSRQTRHDPGLALQAHRQDIRWFSTTPMSRAIQDPGPPGSSRDCRFAVATRDRSPWGPPPPSVSAGSAASANGHPGPG